MATVNGTVTGVNLLSGEGTGAGSRKVYEVAATFTIYTSGDTGTITGLQDRIEEITKNGKTLTLISAAPAQPGTDGNGASAYVVIPVTNSSGTVTFGMGTQAQTAGNVAASTGVKLIAVVDEA